MFQFLITSVYKCCILYPSELLWTLSNENSAAFFYFRDLSVIRSEVNKSARTVQGACMDLDKNMRSLDSNLKLELEEERDKRVQVQ